MINLPSNAQFETRRWNQTGSSERHLFKGRIGKLASWIIAATLLGPAGALQAQQAPAPTVREFPVGALKHLGELPAGRFRSELDQLSPAARDRALEWLRGVHLPAADVASLHTDKSGGICYGCKFSHPERSDEPLPVPSEPQIGLAAIPISPFPANLVFHSRPGAPNVLYINFGGETVAGTEWNTVLGRTSIPAVAYSTDADLTTFNDAEQTAIKRIWQRMTEDYSSFNIDVTTERPANYGSSSIRVAMALITRKTDANGAPNPYETSGGVAYVNVFGRTDFVTRYSPAWVYQDNLSNNESLIAEAASHEIGHNLGLSHDGTPTSEYYGGHGSNDISWGPIMGTGYNRNVSQWSKGEYFNYNTANTQDDLATIAAKISYRTDDHGNTPGTATSLTVTGGTSIVSTTLENDPGNATPVNKGVIASNTDVDVFSFVTGSGPVQLNANPWIMPAGTRGGNLDILLQLYNEAGQLVTSSNPDLQTTAAINTTLAQGRYYLHVRNSGAGNPLVSLPTGYTSYGSIGEYFISGTLMDPTGFVVPPVAEAQFADLTQTGQITHPFTVTYSDNVAINVATIGTGDVRVTGPGGFNQLAQLVSVSSSTNGTPRSATYAVSPVGGGNWSQAHNGAYFVSLEASQVADTEGAFAPAGALGQFNVAVPVVIYSANMTANPGWTLQPAWQYGPPAYSSGGPTGGFTGSNIIGYNLAGTYPNTLAVKYATTPIINAAGSSSLTLRFRRWLGLKKGGVASIEASTDGVSWAPVWSTASAVSDSGWQVMQYSLPAVVVGSSSLRLRWALSSDVKGNGPSAIGWNIDDVEILGGGTLDATSPVASLSVGNITVAGSPSQTCSVTYTDATAVRLSSLDVADLLVLGPSGPLSPLTVESVGADLSVNGSPLTGSYSIAAPGGNWDPADNGSYTITLQEGAVEDTLSNVMPETVLGTFLVNISTATPGVLAVTPPENLVSSLTAGGPFTPASQTYTLNNSGGTTMNWAVSKTAAWLNLSVGSGSLAPGASTVVTVSINSTASSLAAGSYADTVNFENTTNNNGNTSRSVSLTVNSPGVLAVPPGGDLSAFGLAGGPFSPASVEYTLNNSGGTALDWSASNTTAWVSLSSSSGSLAAGGSVVVTVSINSAADALTPGSYSDTVSFADTTAAGQPITRVVTLGAVAPLKTGIQRESPTGIFQIVVQGTPGTQVAVEASENLSNWKSIGTGQIGLDGILTLDDSESAALKSRFYRAHVIP